MSHLLVGTVALERVPLHRIVIKADHGYRMDDEHAMTVARHLVEGLDSPPVLLKTIGDGYFQVMDGRHRFVAALLAGRRDLLAVTVGDVREVSA